MQHYTSKIRRSMQRSLLGAVVLLGVILPVLVACGTPSAAQQVAATPTPLPLDPALERPTYAVQRGTITRPLETTGRVTPIDLVLLSFKAEGRVVKVNVKRGDTVKAGDVLAEIEQDEALNKLRQAENMLVQAQRDLENAKTEQELQIARAELTLKDALATAAQGQQQQADLVKQAEANLAKAQKALAEARQLQAEQVAQAEQTLERAKANLARLLPGGADDRIKVAQETLDKAKQTAEETKIKMSEAKTRAEDALRKASETLQDAQREYSTAFWNNDWVEKHGTDPDNPTKPDPVTGNPVPNELTDKEKAKFKQDLVVAERAVREAERGVEFAQRTLDQAKQAEIQQNQQADKVVQDAQKALDQITSGAIRGDSQIAAAQEAVVNAERALAVEQRKTVDETAVQYAQIELEKARRGTNSSNSAVESARLALEAAKQGSFHAKQTAVEDAQIGVEQARKAVEAGRITAPQAGEVMSIGVGEGDTVEAFDPVVELADPSKLEVGAELSAEQMRQLAEGQLATISLLARPDVLMPATIRRLPAPYGVGGTGAVQEQDKTTRFQITDLKGQALTPGAVTKITIVLEKKDNVLWLPPDAIRSFEGRRFVVVKEGNRERRVPVRLGIETEERVELVEGVEQGDIVIGP